jgi:D-amino-acid oxidase
VGGYGVREERCHIFYVDPPSAPLLADIVDHSTRTHEPTLPGDLAWHWEFDSLLIEIPEFMARLHTDLANMGVEMQRQAYVSQDSFHTLPADLVINCSGLGSRGLTGDTGLVPIRGQLLHLRPQPVPNKLTVEWNGRSIYWMSREDALILGGSYEVGEEVEVTAPSTLDALWNAHQAWPEAGAGGLPAPRLHRDDVIGAMAGIRPHRRQGVRLEVDQTGALPVIHNYAMAHAASALPGAVPSKSPALWPRSRLTASRATDAHSRD